MSMSRLIAVLALSALLSACGGNDTKEVDCEVGLKFQDRTVGKRVVPPADLDPLDEFAEMPIPKADPDAPAPVAGVCNDMPPVIQTSN